MAESYDKAQWEFKGLYLESNENILCVKPGVLGKCLGNHKKGIGKSFNAKLSTL